MALPVGNKVLLDTSVLVDYLRTGRASGDRLGRLNDLLIGLTAREIGATVLTRNVDDFARIATVVRGLAVTVSS